MKDVKIKRVRQVVPEIKELSMAEPEERHLVAPLGTLEQDKSSALHSRPEPAEAARRQVRHRRWKSLTIRARGKRETTGHVPLEMTYTAAATGYVNAEVAKHIDEVQIFELNKNLQKAIATNNKEEVKKVAQAIEKKGEVMGPRAAKKTMLAKQVLQEMNAGGRVSKKTQLAMDDAAREAAESADRLIAGMCDILRWLGFTSRPRQRARFYSFFL